MALQMDSGTYLSGKEAAAELGMAYGTFCNKRTTEGDRFLLGHELVTGRIFFRVEEVARLRSRL
jgi:hypothetical protein